MLNDLATRLTAVDETLSGLYAGLLKFQMVILTPDKLPAVQVGNQYDATSFENLNKRLVVLTAKLNDLADIANSYNLVDISGNHARGYGYIPIDKGSIDEAVTGYDNAIAGLSSATTQLQALFNLNGIKEQ